MGQCLSHKSMLGGNNKTIEFVVEKAFLEAVEKQNKSRNDIVCVDVCDTLPDLFGTPGPTVRRALQQHWKNLKNRTIKSYANYLDRFVVPHSEATRRELEMASNTPSDNGSVGSAPSVSPPPASTPARTFASQPGGFSSPPPAPRTPGAMFGTPTPSRAPGATFATPPPSRATGAMFGTPSMFHGAIWLWT